MRQLLRDRYFDTSFVRLEEKVDVILKRLDIDPKEVEEKLPEKYRSKDAAKDTQTG